MAFRNRIKSSVDLRNEYSEIIKLTNQRAMKEAEKLYDQYSVFEPYNPELLYHLAKGFAKSNKKKTLEYLTLVYDIDSIYLDKARKENTITKFIEEIDFEEILSGELSRMWNNIDFNQIEPDVIQDNIHLYFDKSKKDKVLEIIYDLEDRVSDFFGWNNSWEDRSMDERIDDCFVLESNCDRTYVKYAQLFMAFKKLSPYCENIRFIMSSEPVSYVDEIVIEDGVFYSFRHMAKGPYWDDKLEVMEQLADQLTSDINLCTYVSNEWTGWADLEMDYIGKEEDETVSERIVTVEKYLSKAFHYNPRNPEAYYQRGRLYTFKGNKKEAKADFLQTVTLDNHHFNAYYNLSKLEYKEHHFDLALEYLNKAQEIRPEYLDLYFKRGRVYLKLNDLEHAEKDFETCIEKVKNHNASTLLRYANTLVDNKHYQQAEGFYAGVFEKNKSYTEELKKRGIKSNDPSTNFYTNLFDKVKRQNSDAYIGLSLIEGDYKHAYEKALKYIKQAIILNSESAIAWYNQGHVYQNLGKLDKAEMSYDKSIKLDETDFRPFHNKSMIYLEKKDYEEAIQLANIVPKKEPQHLDSFIVKGNALYYLKRYKRAIQVYKKAIMHFPESDMGYHGVGLCYSWLKKDEEALEYNRKAGELNPNNYFALSNLGNNLCNLGRYNEALKVLDQVIASTPGYYHSYYVKACVYALTGKKEQAFEMIKQTLKCDPNQKENLRKEKDFKEIRRLKEFKKIFEE